MLQISQGLMIGVTAGLIATALTIGFKAYWERFIVPWYIERLYKDVDIGGTWFGVFMYHNQEMEEFFCEIRRKGHQIFGEMISKHDGKTYDFKGEFRDMILTINYESRIRQEIDRGCFTFLLMKSGQEMEGLASYYYDPTHTVQIGSMKLTRQDDAKEFEDASEEDNFQASHLNRSEEDSSGTFKKL